MNIVIPMAGEGNRFLADGFNTPKPLITVDGKTLIEHSIDSLGIDGTFIFITKQYKDENHNAMLSKIFEALNKNFIEIRVSDKQFGTSYSALRAKELIDNEEELLMINCDQKLDWNPEPFIEFARSGFDGSVLVHDSDHPKHSYAIVEDGVAKKFAEKQVISKNALVGLHYWKHGKDFVSSAEELIANSAGSLESYVSQTYNYMLSKGKNIGAYKIEKSSYIPLGTPEDIKIYENKIGEYYENQPKTIFLDIDGTILKHSYHKDPLGKGKPEVLEGVTERINGWRSDGHVIVITTARSEPSRKQLEFDLHESGIQYDQLVMGLAKGARVLVNDRLKESDPQRAIGINVITDSSFNETRWEDYDL